MIVATNMLESMITNPTPTRAEVSDIAIAVREGTDAVMLSGETAYGQFPFKSVSVMATVAKRTENAMLTYQACFASCCLLCDVLSLCEGHFSISGKASLHVSVACRQHAKPENNRMRSALLYSCCQEYLAL